MSAEESIETWKEITGAPGYEISTWGRPRSWRSTNWRPNGILRRRREPKLIAIFSLPGGYQYVNLSGCRPRRRYVHRLVLETFVGPCPEGMECCHWDGNPSNNYLSNLRWDTPKGNRRDTDRHHGPRIGSNNPCSKLNELQVLEIKHLLSLGVTQREIGKRFGIRQTAVSLIAVGKRWAHVD